MRASLVQNEEMLVDSQRTYRSVYRVVKVAIEALRVVPLAQTVKVLVEAVTVLIEAMCMSRL